MTTRHLTDYDKPIKDGDILVWEPQTDEELIVRVCDVNGINLTFVKQTFRVAEILHAGPAVTEGIKRQFLVARWNWYEPFARPMPDPIDALIDAVAPEN